MSCARRDEAIAVLRSLGADLVEVRVPIDFDDIAARLGKVLAAEAYALHRAYIEDEALDIDPWVRKRMLGGKAISAADYLGRPCGNAQDAGGVRRVDARARRVAHAYAADHRPCPSRWSTKATAPLAAFTRGVNYLGACGLSLPAGFSSAGLPIGVQIIGAPCAEATLVRIGRAFQSVTDWHRRRPAVCRWGARSLWTGLQPYAMSRRAKPDPKDAPRTCGQGVSLARSPATAATVSSDSRRDRPTALSPVPSRRRAQA